MVNLGTALSTRTLALRLQSPRYTRGDFERDEALAVGLDQECHEPSTDGCKIARSNPLDFSLFRKSLIDADYSNGDGNPKVNLSSRAGNLS